MIITYHAALRQVDNQFSINVNINLLHHDHHDYHLPTYEIHTVAL
jgi:hypothetical protein